MVNKFDQKYLDNCQETVFRAGHKIQAIGMLLENYFLERRSDPKFYGVSAVLDDCGDELLKVARDLEAFIGKSTFPDRRIEANSVELGARA